MPLFVLLMDWLQNKSQPDITWLKDRLSYGDYEALIRKMDIPYLLQKRKQLQSLSADEVNAMFKGETLSSLVASLIAPSRQS